jgi:hypothetical protein
MTATFADQGNASNGGVIEVSYVENRVKTEPMLYGLLFLVTNVEATVRSPPLPIRAMLQMVGSLKSLMSKTVSKPNPCSMDFFFSSQMLKPRSIRLLPLPIRAMLQMMGSLKLLMSKTVENRTHALWTSSSREVEVILEQMCAGRFLALLSGIQVAFWHMLHTTWRHGHSDGGYKSSVST